ncbi:MAG: MFS transporter [Pseudomonadota bacterium]
MMLAEEASAPVAEKVGRAKLAVIGTISVAHDIPAALLQTLVPIIYTRALGLPLKDAWVFSIPIAVTALKWLWAPLVDRIGSVRFGRRRSWILPTAFLVSLLYFTIAQVQPTLENIWWMVGLFLVVKIVFSTHEIAADAYVAEALRGRQRGVGSAAVWLGKEIGQIVGLAGTLAIADAFGWSAAFSFVAVLFALLNLAVLLRAEDPPWQEADAARTRGDRASPLKYFREGVNRQVLALIFCFAFAVQMPPAIIGVFLSFKGLSLSEVGLAIGVAATAGAVVSLLAASRIVARVGVKRLAIWLIPVGLLALPPFLYLTVVEGPTTALVIAVIFWGAVCTAPIRMAFYAARIGWTSRSQVGTDFTIQQSMWFLGYAASLAFSVRLADAYGFTVFFVVNGVLVTAMMLIFILRFDRISDGIAAWRARAP